MEDFMKIPVGIVGYGNLGKAVEKKLENNPNFELVAIFSKRNLQNTVDIKKIEGFKNKIDLLFLCGGSQNELENQAFALIKHFNIAESYDNHARLKNYHTELDILAKQHKKVALCSLGWDPGLFSFMRGLFNALGENSYTFWGKGLSQGHTQAIKNIEDVNDALQFTIPNEEFIEKVKNGENLTQSKVFHKRLCYIVAEPQHQTLIQQKITHMKDYFEGYETIVNFVTQEQLNSLKTFSHRGEVLTLNNKINFSLNLPSNPDFTATVLTSFARNFNNLKLEKKFGAYTIFDLPLKNLVDDKYKFL